VAQHKLAINTHVAERLQKEPIIWLSTVRPNQRPHLVPVWFLWDNNEEILIFSKPENQKIRNIRQNNNVALALEAIDEGGDVVLLDGTAEILSTPSSEVVSPAYIAKYGQTMQQMGWQAEGMAKEYSQPIRIKLTRVVNWGE
jgi:PPOX class probable F420-dependent enzyme